MSGLIQDIRYAVRLHARHPIFTAVALLTIALGIGANTAVFSVVDDVLLRPIRAPDEGRVVQLVEEVPAAGTGSYTVSLPNFEDYRALVTTLEPLVALQAPRPSELFVAGATTRPVKLNAYVASSGLLSLLGASPIAGRSFQDDEDRPGGPRAIVLSDAMWERLFARDPAAIGRTLTVLWPEGQFTIVGILPPGFEVPPVTHNATGGFGGKGLALRVDCDALVSLSMLPPAMVVNPNARQFRQFATLGRLKAGVDLARTQAEVDQVTAQIGAAHQFYEGYSVTVMPLRQVLQRAYGPGLFFLWATVGLALLVVCVNVAGFLLASAAGRDRELGVRLALGSRPSRLARQLLTESLALGVTGGVLGVVLAVWGVRLLGTWLPGYMYRLDEVSLDSRGLLFAVGATLLTAALFGLLPAARAWNPALIDGLRDATRSSGGRRLRLLSTLVVAEVAVAVVLLTGAGLMVASFRQLTAVDPGFDRARLLALEVDNLPAVLSKYQGPASDALRRDIMATVRQVPGVEAVAATSHPPLGIFRGVTSFTLADRPPPAPGELRPSLNFESVTVSYFDTMDIRILAGRSFTDDDGTALLALGPEDFRRYQAASAVEQDRMRREVRFPVVINDVMAEQYWPGESPLGRQLYFGAVDLESPPLTVMTIVGVVAEVKTKSLAERPRIQAYVPATGFLPWLMIRTRVESTDVTEQVRAAIERVDPAELTVADVTSMEDLYRDATADGRAQMALVVTSAGLTAVLAAVGLFGVMAYRVTQRTREIGIRLSLGAEPQSIVRRVLGQAFALTGAGVAIGLAGSIVLTRAISSLLFGVQPAAPTTFLIVTGLLLIVTLAACLIPARQASRVDPVQALRAE